ncbi:YsnF/AvaK domain-containing protein [Peribacillus glennii]|nr:YsnF/AvaK domain-containing protein [Peribacillus glennii]
MEKTVYGVFDSTPEVIQAINALKAKGYEGDDITVIADNEDKLEFAEYTDTRDVNTVTNTQEDESFMDKVMRFFMNEGTYGLEDRLSAAGLSDSETAAYVNDVEDGKILVLLDAEKETTVREEMFEGDMERDRLRTERMDVTGINTTGVTNNPDPNIFPEGTAGIQETTGDLATGGTRGRHLTTGRLENEGYSVSGTGTADGMLTDEEKTLRLREEQLEIDKQEVQSGEVVINKEVNEEQRTVNVPVEHEEVYVERRPVKDGTMNAKDAGPITDGETIRIPVVEEQVEVTKRPVVTDEVVIGKRTVQETQHVQDTVKKEEIKLDKDGNPLVRENREDVLSDNNENMLDNDRQLKNRIDTDKL